MAFLLDSVFRCTIPSCILNPPGFRAEFPNPHPTLFYMLHFHYYVCTHVFHIHSQYYIPLSPVEPPAGWVKISRIFECVILKSTFWGAGFHLEILLSWWLFPGLTRQGSVNSARAAEVVGSPAGQWAAHNDSGTQDGGGFLSFFLA